MRVVIAGGHGKIALQLSRLADAVVGLIRNPDHADDVAATGAEAAVFDLESGGIAELAERLEGADAVVFAAYLRAKAASELELRARDLDWTVLRPGTLTNHNPTGTVRLGPPTVGRGQISRADVAAVLLALLDEPRSAGLTLEVVDGGTPIADAVRAVVRR